MRREGLTLIELMVVVVMMGILAAIAIPNCISMQDRGKEARSKGQVHTLQLAAEDYAVRHDGIYSDQREDLLPLLPNGQMLENSFTGQLTEPRFGEVADEPGEIGIVLTMKRGQVVGYTITVYGKYGMIMAIKGGEE